MEAKHGLLFRHTRFQQFIYNAVFGAVVLYPDFVVPYVNVNHVAMHTLFAVPPGMIKQEYLSGHPAIASFRLGKEDEGGGTTVVTFKT
jgi:hypothetical protein